MTISLLKEYGVYLDTDYNVLVARPTETFYPPYAPPFYKFLKKVKATTNENAIRIYKESEG